MSRQDTDWPYGDPDPEWMRQALSWTCPVGICDCSNADSEQGFEFAVMLCTHEGERMKHARCRVWVNGLIVNDDLRANHEGWMSVFLQHDVETAFVEWAPTDTPIGHPYPYRKLYYVALREHLSADEAARRRLHNLGFSAHATMRENIEDFQIEYGYENVSGDLADIEEDLCEYHDEAVPPIVRQEPPPTPLVAHDTRPPPPDGQIDPEDDVVVAAASPAAPEPSTEHTFVTDPAQPLDDAPGDPGGGPVKQEKPGDPPTQGDRKAGDGHGQGTLRATVSPPNIIDVINQTKHEFEWAQIYSEIEEAGQIVAGFFWVFRDALTTEANLRLKDDATGTVTNEKVQLRVPCTAGETWKAATLIKSKQADLPFAPTPPVGTDELVSMPPTPKLLDIRYVRAQTQITPCSGYMNKQVRVKDPTTGKTKIKLVPIPFEVGTAKHHLCIEKKVLAEAGSTKPSQVGLLADPGKFWVVTRNSSATQGVNYGWHVPTSEVKDRHLPKGKWRGTPAGRAASTPPYEVLPAGKGELWVLQPLPGTAHGVSHKDYSQTLLLVSGWCVIGKGTTLTWTKTRDVLTHATRFKLVSHESKELADDQLPQP